MPNYLCFVDITRTFPIILGRQKWKITEGTATKVSVFINEAAFGDWTVFSLSAAEKAQTRKLPKEQVFHEIPRAKPEKREYTLTLLLIKARDMSPTPRSGQENSFVAEVNTPQPLITRVPNRIMRGGESKTYTTAAMGIHALFILIFVGWSALICHVLIAGAKFCEWICLDRHFEAFKSSEELFESLSVLKWLPAWNPSEIIPNVHFVTKTLWHLNPWKVFRFSMQITAFPKYSETNDYAKQFSLTRNERVGEAILIKGIKYLSHLL